MTSCLGSNAVAVIPVSYTHLDVYKRQEYDYTYEELGEAVQELLPGRGFVRYEEHGAARQELPGGGSVSLDAEIEILSIEKNYSTAMVVCTDGNRIFAVGFQGGGIPTHYRMDNIGLLPFDTVVDVDGRYPLMVKSLSLIHI